MSLSVLITDTLFIEPRHEKILTDNGFVIDRITNPKASEDELISKIKGKDFYILGGIEQVTDNVINAADQLKGICFTGTDYIKFIPGHELATQKGVAITNAPGANALAVANYALTLMLAMNRHVFELGRIGINNFKTAQAIQDLNIGLVGFGNIARILAKHLKGIGVQNVFYTSRERKPDDEKGLGIQYLPLEKMLKMCDILSLHTPKIAGEILGAAELQKMKDQALIINCAHPFAINFDALAENIKTKRLSAAYDAPPEGNYQDLPIERFYCSNDSCAYNTSQANALASDMAIQSLLNIWKTRDDHYLVNPEYKK